jgi:hypothetical protein
MPIEPCAICEYIEPSELDPCEVRVLSFGAQERKRFRGGSYRVHARCVNRVVQEPCFPELERKRSNE